MTTMVGGVILPILALIALGASLPAGDNGALLYLAQYGYFPSSSTQLSSIIDETKFSQAISEFQSFAGLNVTGDLDEETKHTMTLPRCGVRDIVGAGSDSRSKRFALQGSRWKVKDLNYRITKYPKNLKKSDVDKEIQRAFDVWSMYTDLKFSHGSSTSRIHIDIRFESGEHGDGDPFDGPGGTLAHAYFPVYGGDAHFDASETWTVRSYKGTNLFQVAAHEFGHSLGLSHSDVRSALMAPFYRGYQAVFELDRDDIEGIQALYGKKTSSSRPTSPPSTFGGGDDDDDDEPGIGNGIDSALCKDPKFDTIFRSADDKTYVFKGNNYWQLGDDAVMPGYPKLISKKWPGLPGDIDAAFTYKNGKTYFFKGTQYWRYQGSKMDGAYPRDISEGFTGVPDYIDAATVWSGNGKIYFYKGSKFWRFDPMQRPPVKSGYPKPLSNWEGVPNNIDAAFKDANGYTYFFKSGAYYRFNDRAFAVDSTNPAFPRSSAAWWFGCKEAPRGTIGTSASRGSLISGESDGGYTYGEADGDIEADKDHGRVNSRRSGSQHLLASLCLITTSLLLHHTTS